MRKRRELNVISISFLDLLSGALGAVIILYVALPKNKVEMPVEDNVAKVSQDLIAAQAEVLESRQKIVELKKQLAQVSVSASTPSPEKLSSGKDLDVGFKFKGKNIVFLIDTSLSMIEEDRMGQVKAGLKMLLTSLPTNYNVDIVQYPNGQSTPYKSLWGNIKPNQSMNKLDAFDFIYDLRPNGGTPTREALLFVLRNYDNLSDIVLLSDGAPTFHNSNKKDDIFDILKVVRENNPHKIQINTIGVGSEFIKDQTSDRYRFLSLLSEETGGFFVGF